MKVAKWGDSLAIQIPEDVVIALGLQEGDEVDLRTDGDRRLVLKREIQMTPKEAVERIRRMAKPLPPGYKWDREEANAR